MVKIIQEDASPGDVAKLFNVSRESLEKLQIYAGLLEKWQKRINLVGPQELPRLWSRHIADALQMVEHIPENIDCGIDLGSGAGIPGIILAEVLAPRGFHIHLVESNGKKAAFLREAVRLLGVSADVHCNRIEALYDREWADNVQIVFARALAPLPKLIDLSAPFVEKSGEMLFLKGLDVDSELTQTTKCWNIDYQKHPSRTYAGGCILSIKDFQRAPISSQSKGCK